ncbi:MAG TPA: chloramphenicol acetyltransferase [Anaerolineales bacterium]|nr:chloramphenicol acetyltransferase [Anaerolineales bacterium]
MHKIDMHTWSRREHFEYFNTFNHPHFNLCANMDLTRLHPYIKEHGFSLTAAIIYLISRAANAIPEFRYRIREGEVVEHETVSPSVTILVANDLFSFCSIDYSPDFSEFAERSARLIAAVKQGPMLKDPPGRDDLLFMTAIPWVSFTSFTHPMRLHPADSIPRFAWGKYFQEGNLLKMPLSVQGHHALMDGIHMGRFYAEMEEYLGHPAAVLADPRNREQAPPTSPGS